jgi:nucleotide-binding universal stress UspA family protein
MVSNGYVPYAFAVPPQVQAEAERKASDAAWATAQCGAALACEAGLDADALAVQTGAGIWPALLSIADEHNVAALVAGRRGLSGVKSVLLGSVSAGLVHHSRRPVLIVPPGVRHPDSPLRVVVSADQPPVGSA